MLQKRLNTENLVYWPVVSGNNNDAMPNARGQGYFRRDSLETTYDCGRDATGQKRIQSALLALCAQNKVILSCNKD